MTYHLSTAPRDHTLVPPAHPSRPPTSPPQLSDPAFLSRLRPDQVRAQVRALDLQFQLDKEGLEGRYAGARAALEAALEANPQQRGTG